MNAEGGVVTRLEKAMVDARAQMNTVKEQIALVRKNQEKTD